MKTLITICLLSTLALAQATHLGASATISTSRNLGYENPNAGILIDGAKRYGNFVGYLELGWLRAHKLQTSDGNAFTSTAGGRYNVYRGVFLGGGVGINHQITSVYSKAAISPFGEVGFDYKHLAIFSAAGIYPTGENKTKGYIFRLDGYPVLNKEHQVYLRGGVQVGTFAFYSGGQNWRGIRVGLHLGIEKRF